MVEPTNKIEKAVEQLKVYTAQEFINEYKALVDKTGFQIVVQPTLIARDDGTWSIKQISSVGRIPKSTD